MTHIKRFLSGQIDNVTLKYEALTSDLARRCIFMGTSNEENPLRGENGNRRFLPVTVPNPIDIEYVRANLDLLVGEAATLEAAGELFLIPKDVIPEARARQEAVRAESDIEVYLKGWFEGETRPAYIMPTDLLELLRQATGRSVQPNQYGTAMKNLGFVKTKPRLTKGSDKQTPVWCHGDMSAAVCYLLSRDSLTGRLSPKLPPEAKAAKPGGPPMPPATVLPFLVPVSGNG